MRRGIAHRNDDEDAHSVWRYQQLDGSLNLTDQGPRKAHPQSPLGETGQNRQVRVRGPRLIVSGDADEAACHIYDERWRLPEEHSKADLVKHGEAHRAHVGLLWHKAKMIATLMSDIEVAQKTNRIARMEEFLRGLGCSDLALDIAPCYN